MKTLKNLIRAMLLVGCVTYLALFTKDLESIVEYQRLTMTVHPFATWFWLFFGEFLPVVALVFASIYACSKYLWKKRWALTVAVALMCVMLAFSEVLHVNKVYDTLHPSVALMAGAIYITCIYAVKVPFRRYIACGALAILLVSYCLAGTIDGTFASAFKWALRYSAPLISLSLLGLILPERYD